MGAYKKGNSMKYYVIRQPDGTLWLCFTKPVRWAETGMWCVNGGNMKRLPDGDFEEVKASAREPAELEMSLTIKSLSHET